MAKPLRRAGKLSGEIKKGLSAQTHGQSARTSPRSSLLVHTMPGGMCFKNKIRFVFSCGNQEENQKNRAASIR
jgi:hypothetical protein